jgi:hypothetical protein
MEMCRDGVEPLATASLIAGNCFTDSYEGHDTSSGKGRSRTDNITKV